MAGRHRLQHVEDLGAAHLADDDAVGTHTQTVAHEFTLRDFTFAFNVGRPRLEPHYVGLLQQQFRPVFDRNDAFVARDARCHPLHPPTPAVTTTTGHHPSAPA